MDLERVRECAGGRLYYLIFVILTLYALYALDQPTVVSLALYALDQPTMLSLHKQPIIGLFELKYIIIISNFRNTFYVITIYPCPYSSYISSANRVHRMESLIFPVNYHIHNRC